MSSFFFPLSDDYLMSKMQS